MLKSHVPALESNSLHCCELGAVCKLFICTKSLTTAHNSFIRQNTVLFTVMGSKFEAKAGPSSRCPLVGGGQVKAGVFQVIISLERENKQ